MKVRKRVGIAALFLEDCISNTYDGIVIQTFIDVSLTIVDSRFHVSLCSCTIKC